MPAKSPPPPDPRFAWIRIARTALASRARITLLQPSPDGGFGLGDLAKVDRLLADGERMGEAALSLCMGADGRMKPGVIHDPLHLHEWPGVVPSSS